MGIWEPHTSSVDFCEPNYFLTDLIAEPHNAFSSLILTIPCFAGLSLFGGNPLSEFRHDLMFAVLIAIGFGSFLLHCTLGWVGQSLDEVPMLWMTLTYIYCLVELNSPSGSSRIPNFEWYLVACAVVQTLIYFSMRSVYWVFLLIYTSTVVVVRVQSFLRSETS
jgi:dihydroceramidase